MHLPHRQLKLGVLAVAIVTAALPGAAAAATGRTERVSVSTSAIQANGRSGVGSWRPAISADGNLVAFDSNANNLAPGATSGQDNVYLRDRASGATELVSVTGNGSEPNGPSSEPDLSGDGRYVAFHTAATNLVPGGPAAGIVVYDRTNHTTTPVSVTGKKGADGQQPSISDDGRYVAFESSSPDLASGAKSSSTLTSYIYVRDLVKQKTELVSVDSSGKPAGASFDPSISSDGRYVAFDSNAPLVAGDTNAASDVFVRDLVTGSTIRVSVDSTGGQSRGGNFDPSISSDGRYVAFDADTPLAPNDTNSARDVYVHDMLTGQTTGVSVDSVGNHANDHSDLWSLGGVQQAGVGEAGPQISGDGRYVAFESTATNLVAGDTNTCTLANQYNFPATGQCPDVFMHDLQTGATTRASLDSIGSQADGPSADPAINSDGSAVAFMSAATNLVSGDTNTCGVFTNPGQCPDILVHIP